MRSFLIPMLASFCASLAWGAARAETTDCSEITALPATVTVPGVYCLTSDLATSQTSGAAITIAANSVTLDMNGWKLGGLGGGPASTAVGISVANRKNFSLRNGMIRGFRHGVEITDTGASTGHLVEDVSFDANIFTGIAVAGSNYQLRRNSISNTVTTTDHATGIHASGSGAVIADNVITNVSGIDSGGVAPSGIRAYELEASTIEGNSIVGVDSNQFGSGITVSESELITVRGNKILEIGHVSMYGISIATSDGVVIRDNFLTTFDVTADAGIFALVSATNVSCVSNFIDGFSSPTGGCAFESGNLAP